MNLRRAFAAFLIAGLVPVAIGMLAAPASSSSLIAGIGISVIVYLFSLPIIFGAGFAALFLSLKLKYGPLFIPLLFGAGVSLLIGKISYTEGTELSDMKLLFLDGISTALVASLIYFIPDIRQKFGKPRSS